MILLVFLTPFILVIGWLVMLDNSNIEEVNKYYKNNSCQKIYYYKSRFKSTCENKIIIINNQFSIDFNTNIYIKYIDIQTLQNEKTNLHIKTKKESFILSFPNIDEVEEFKKSLEDKIRWMNL